MSTTLREEIVNFTKRKINVFETVECKIACQTLEHQEGSCDISESKDKLCTLPVGFAWDQSAFTCRDSNAELVIYERLERQSETSVQVYRWTGPSGMACQLYSASEPGLTSFVFSRQATFD